MKLNVAAPIKPPFFFHCTLDSSGESNNNKLLHRTISFLLQLGFKDYASFLFFLLFFFFAVGLSLVASASNILRPFEQLAALNDTLMSLKNHFFLLNSDSFYILFSLPYQIPNSRILRSVR